MFNAPNNLAKRKDDKFKNFLKINISMRRMRNGKKN